MMKDIMWCQGFLHNTTYLHVHVHVWHPHFTCTCHQHHSNWSQFYTYMHMYGTSTTCTYTLPPQTSECLRTGALSRTVACTNMNAQSSRSHAIFTLNIIQKRPIVGEVSWCCHGNYVGASYHTRWCTCACFCR